MRLRVHLHGVAGGARGERAVSGPGALRGPQLEVVDGREGRLEAEQGVLRETVPVDALHRH